MRNSCAGKWSVQTVFFFFLIKSFKLYRCVLSNNMNIDKTKIGIHSVLNFFHMLLVSQI